MPDIPRYHQQIRAARELGLTLSAAQERELLALLADYADELAKRIRSGLASQNEREVYRQVEQLFRELSRDMASRVGAGIRLTAERVAELHARATIGLAGEAVVGTAFSGVGAAAATAVLARPELAEAFRTIRSTGAADVNRIIKRALLHGQGTRVIERQVRMYIGAPGSLLEGDAELLRDLRRIGYATLRDLGLPEDPALLRQVRKEAATIRGKAQLIARTEIANAQHEAHAESAARSPVIAGVRVQLSGRHPAPDQCDVAAELDLYGLGPGVYPPDRVPARFHPRCLCLFRDVLRPVSEWGTPPKEVPPLVVDWEEGVRVWGLSPSQVSALRASIETGEARAEERRKAA